MAMPETTQWLKVRIKELTPPLINNILANDFTPVAVGTWYEVKDDTMLGGQDQMCIKHEL